MTAYQRPDLIPDDMGGTEAHLDERLTMVLELLESAPLEDVHSVLDIGMGKGQLAHWFAARGKRVVGTGLAMGSYGLNEAALSAKGISMVECPVEVMPFASGQFNAVVMSHILEHVPNVGLALQEVRRVLADTGWLFIFVPPHDDYVAAGHISTGWNIGQLMYVLAVNGFNVRDGRFIQYGYNVCAFVQKRVEPLPALRGDRGDIYILDQNNIFPLPIISSRGVSDGYYGTLKAVNWPGAERLVKRTIPSRLKFLQTLARLIPAPLRPKAATAFRILSASLEAEYAPERDINPRALRG